MAQRSDQTDLLPAIILKLGAGEIAEAAGVEPEVVAAIALSSFCCPTSSKSSTRERRMCSTRRASTG
jgi:hypothetical protein